MLSLFAKENISFLFQSTCEKLFMTFEWLNTSERDFKAEIVLTASHEWSQSSN